MQIQWKLNTKIGPIYLWASLRGVEGVFWKEQNIPMASSLAEDNPMVEFIRVVVFQLEEYLDGQRQSFDIKINLVGTAFQKKVWAELRRIPYGQIVSYGEIAKRIGRARAVRAVGTAIGKNPLCLVIPCHRVISASGSLGGFNGGLPLKIKLLDLEGHKNLAITKQSKYC